MPESDPEKFEVLVRTFHEVAGVSTGSIRPDSLLIEEVGLDSLSLVEIVYVLEDRLKIAVPEQSLTDVKTVKDLFDLF